MRELLEAMAARLPAMTQALKELVLVESPSKDLEAIERCAAAVTALGGEVLGAHPERIERDGRSHLLWSSGPAAVLLLAHYDTVWPLGTIREWPFAVTGGIATGPGAFDMKAGIVQALHAMAALDDRSGVTLLVTADEEIGSPSSRDLIEETARGARAVFVLEAAADGGALKIARKGVSGYVVDVEGRAAHAGLEPHKGVNALIELSHQVLALEAIADADAGTTVTPTVAAAGTTMNVVPARASIQIDVRVATPQEQQRVDDDIRTLRPVLEGARVIVHGGPNRPPLPETMARPLFDRARTLAAELGLGDLNATAVGGGSDGNFTAGIGVPTLDGLGAVGGGAHARNEHVVLASMPQRAALVAALIDDVRKG